MAELAISESPYGTELAVSDFGGPMEDSYSRPKTHFTLRIAGLTPVEELEANLNAVVTGSAKTQPMS